VTASNYRLLHRECSKSADGCAQLQLVLARARGASYPSHMTTAKMPPSYSKWLDEMRASARMRARLMKKIPKPPELPRRSVDMTNASPPDQRLALAGATDVAVGMRTDANAPQEPPSQPADK
jgi:hypothetical protein